MSKPNKCYVCGTGIPAGIDTACVQCIVTGREKAFKARNTAATERKRCCEDMCLQCEEAARPDSEVHAAERRDHDGHWEHEYIKDGVAYWCSCNAAAIHERAAKEKDA